MNTKIAFFDIDATLFDHSIHRWTPSSVEALNELHKKGVKLFACTARSFANAKRFGILSCGIPWDGGVYAAGSTVIAGTKVISCEKIPLGETRKFLGICRENQIVCEVVGAKSTVYSQKPNENVRALRDILPDNVQVRKYDDKPVTCFLAFCTEEIDDLLRKRFPDFYMFRFHKYGLDVKGKPYQKGDGVKKVLDFYKIDKSESIGFGDDIQDISVAENVGTFIAVGNAKEEVKKAATYVCKPITENGISEFLETYNL